MVPGASTADICCKREGELLQGPSWFGWDLIDGDFVSAASCTNRGRALPPGAVMSLTVVIQKSSEQAFRITLGRLMSSLPHVAVKIAAVFKILLCLLLSLYSLREVGALPT